MENKAIGIFDSGIGGLSVLAQIIKILPNEKYIYYADIENVPYGIKTNKQIKEYVAEAIKFFMSKNVKAIVIACNTATSVTIEDLRKKYTIPIIGIEPAIKPAIEKRNGKKVLLMATPVTIKEQKLKKLLNRIDSEHNIDLLAMPELVRFAEKGDFNSESVKEYINNKLRVYNLNQYSELVLGCTHFPFFKKILKEIFPKNVHMIDGSYGVANYLKEILENNNQIGKEKLQVSYYYSGRKVEDIKELEKLERYKEIFKTCQ